MEFLFFFYFFAGILLGIISGLIPGLHPNSILFLVLPFYYLSNISVLDFIGFVVGISVTNTILNYIPSILLGVPQEDTVLSVLPGHRFVLKGRAYEAIELTILGALSSSIFALFLLPVLFFAIRPLYSFLSKYIHFVLIFLILVMLFKDDKKLKSVLILILSGILGLLVLNSGLGNLYILFPTFAGLFGIPTIFFSLLQENKIPEQNKHRKISLKDAFYGGFFGFIAGILTGFVPGIGSSQSALIIQKFTNMNLRRFMVSLGGINTTGVFFSILSLYLIGKARSGAAIVIKNITTSLNISTVFIIIGLSLVCIGIVVPLGLKLGMFFCEFTSRINYRFLLIFVLALIFAGTLFLSSWFGLLVLLTSSALGLFTLSLKVKRSYCMGVLLIPTILYYAGFSWIISIIF